MCLDEKLWFAEEPHSPGHSVWAAAGEWDVPAAVDSARRGAKETLSTDSRRLFYALVGMGEIFMLEFYSLLLI